MRVADFWEVPQDLSFWPKSHALEKRSLRRQVGIGDVRDMFTFYQRLYPQRITMSICHGRPQCFTPNVSQAAIISVS
jgi:hypothetical protein